MTAINQESVAASAEKDIILKVENLKKYFKTPKGMLHAVDGVSFSLERGKTLGIVGESGCGKSTTGRCVLRLIEPDDGKIFFEGEEITNLKFRQMKAKRRDMQIIFQDPYSSLDPKQTVSQIIREPITSNKLMREKEKINDVVLDLMNTVGLAERLVNTYPHELDGGRRQRIGIARALAMNPKFIVCDEPVSALDVSIQAQILNLLKTLQRERKISYIFITHDLSVVHHFADEIAVMYLGVIVEKAPSVELFNNPLHPYTKALLSAIPVPEVTGNKKQRLILKGELTSPIDPADECRFCKRCSSMCEGCSVGTPSLKEVTPGHFVACHLY